MFENMQGFFESTIGQVATIAVIIVFFGLILIPTGKQKNKKADAKALTISALLIALATVLGQIKLFEMPYGGTVTVFSMLPLALCGYCLLYTSIWQKLERAFVYARMKLDEDNRIAAQPVSYTHLDVYKRQPLPQPGDSKHITAVWDSFIPHTDT